MMELNQDRRGAENLYIVQQKNMKEPVESKIAEMHIHCMQLYTYVTIEEQHWLKMGKPVKKKSKVAVASYLC